MIKVTDRREPKTFTDETSPRQIRKSDRKVSIHGQVIREESLKWFRDLIKLYSHDSREVKSTHIIEQFHTFPKDLQDRTWVGLKNVRIHIVDSLPYQLHLKEVIQNVFKNDGIRKLLQSDSAQGNEFAKRIQAQMDEMVAEDIIIDSTPQRLRDEMNPHSIGGWSLDLRINKPSRFKRAIDLEPFRAKSKSMTSTAVKYASKAASVFTPAIDKVNPMMRYYGDTWGHREVYETLRDSHAFDKGDDKSIRWIDDERKDIGKGGWIPCPSYADYAIQDGESQTYTEFVYGELQSLASHENEFIQAADIAVGFARQDYERFGIAAVAGSFDYVTINGERITQNNAEERFDYWRQLHEHEKNTTQIIITNN